MVGVAGKSKGCNTCRKRKKGCDLARPACGQCVKGGKICGGYQRHLTFIHHKIPGNDPKTSPQQDTFNLDSDVSLATAFCESSHASSAIVMQRSPPSTSPSLRLLSPHLTLTALTTLHTSLFNSSFLPRNTFTIQESFGPFGHRANWTQVIPSLLNNDLSLQLAYLALSSSRIGHDNQDDNLLAVSKKFYGKALREMQRAISDPNRRYTEEMLFACSTLSLYEIFEAQTSSAAQVSSTPNGWLSHAAGVARMLEARGPDSYTTDKGRTVFLHTRVLITIRASTARRGCFLSKPQWLTVPWKNHPKNLQHKLIDIMVFLPVVLEAYDNIETNTRLDSDERRHQRQSLLARCATFCDQLQNWYSQLCADADGRSLCHAFPSDDPSYPFPYQFSFDDHLVAYTIMLYWSCLLVIQGVMCQLQYLLNEDAADPHDVETLPDYVNPRFYAVNIAQALPYFLHPDMGALGPNLALFPLGMAFGFFANPARPSFASDWIATKSLDSAVDVLMKEKTPHGDRSTKDISSWFIKLFTNLSSRSLPGGIFLSGLMRAAENPAAHGGFCSVSEEV